MTPTSSRLTAITLKVDEAKQWAKENLEFLYRSSSSGRHGKRMQVNVNENEQLNVEISNVVASDAELDKLRVGLSREFPKIDALKIKLERESKQGTHYTVRFVRPGPIVFQDLRLIDLLHSIPLVRWSVDAQPSPKGDPGYF